MRLTVITICRNAAVTLRRTVASVLAQTRRPDEYLFVDGQSDDGTPELLDTLCAELSAHGIAARWLRQEPPAPGAAGIPSAWNQGISASTGDVIALLNGDDWYEPTALACAAEVLERHPEAGLAACAVRFMLPDGRVRRVFRPQGMEQLPWRMPLPHPGLFVRREAYERCGLYDVGFRISADYDFVWRCHERGERLVRCDEIVTNMELGGLANSSRGLARLETRRIGCRHARGLRERTTVWLAWLARVALRR